MEEQKHEYPGMYINVMDFGAWAEGNLYRNVDAKGNITYDSSPNQARKNEMGMAHHDDTGAI